MFLILGCFSICWLPYFVVVIFIRILDFTPNPAYELAFTLAMANSGINPLIYAWKNKGIRKAFIRLLQCRTPNYNDSQHNFITNRKEQLKSSPVSGVCIVTDQCILRSEIEMQNKNMNSYSNNNKAKTQESDTNCDKKETVVNGGARIKTEIVN